MGPAKQQNQLAIKKERDNPHYSIFEGFLALRLTSARLSFPGLHARFIAQRLRGRQIEINA